MQARLDTLMRLPLSLARQTAGHGRRAPRSARPRRAAPSRRVASTVCGPMWGVTMTSSRSSQEPSQGPAWRRFLAQDVQGSRSQRPSSSAQTERGLVDESTACRVHQRGPGLHLPRTAPLRTSLLSQASGEHGARQSRDPARGPGARRAARPHRRQRPHHRQRKGHGRARACQVLQLSRPLTTRSAQGPPPRGCGRRAPYPAGRAIAQPGPARGHRQRAAPT